LYLRQLATILRHQGRVNLDFGRRKCRSGDKFERRIAEMTSKRLECGKKIKITNGPNEFASKPQEGLLKVVVGLCRNFKVLKVLLPVEGHGGGLDFPLLDFQGKEVRLG